MSESKQKLETFVQPHDPSCETLSDNEKLQAYEDFSELVDDVLLAHMDSFPKDSATEKTIPSVHFRIIARQDTGRYDSHLELYVHSHEGENGLLSRSIQISAEGKKDTDILYHYESIEGSGEVMRNDEFPAKQLVDVTSDEDRAAGYTRREIDLEEEMENFALEVDMGYNGQPVGPDEVKQLRELVINAPLADSSSF